MRKFTVIALALVATFMFAVPAMALDTTFSGHYRARGMYMDNTDLNDTTGASDAYMDMRFALQTVFKISDTLTLTTAFHALDNKIWGDNDLDSDNANGDVQNDNIDFDTAWVTAKFDLFTLDLGRMPVGTFGTSFLNAATEGDCIVFSGSFEPFDLVLAYQKFGEGDEGWHAPGTDTVADEDRDDYWVDAIYKDENVEAGIKIQYTSDKRVSHTLSLDRKYWTINPYGKGAIGPVNLEAEIGHLAGDLAERDAPTAAVPDIDLDAWAYHLNAGMAFGPATATLGYAHADGEDDDLTTRTAYGLGGRDWQPLLILTSFYMDMNLGGLGNLNAYNGLGAAGGEAATGAGGGAGTLDAGYDMFYLSGTFAVNEDITINGIIATVSADEVETFVAAGVRLPDDDLGVEFDIGVDWKIMENLVYTLKLGFLDAGDFWKTRTAVNTTVDDSTYTVYNQLMVTF